MVGMTYTSYTREQPGWAAQFLAPECLLAAGTQANIAEFKFNDAQTLTLVAGAVTAGTPRTLTLTTGLEASIEKGVVLDFGGGKLFTLTTRAEKGSTKLIGTLALAVAGGETFAYPGRSGMTAIASGTVVGRTLAERDAGAGFGPFVAATDEEIFIVAFPNDFLETDAGITLVRRDTLIYENKLPGWAGFTLAEKTKIRSIYAGVTSANNA